MFNIKKELETKLQNFLDSQEAQKIVKGIEKDDNYIIRFKITNESVDRDGEVLKSGGGDWTHFDKNPVILIDHSYKVGSIAGKCIGREIVGDETFMKVQLAKDVEAGELVKKLHMQGMIKGVSIGFIPLERDPKNSKLITKWESLEASIVAIGSNREALIDDEALAKSMKECGFACKKAKETLKVGDNILYRETITRHGKTEYFPNEPELPFMGKIIAIYNDGNLLDWNELITPTSKNPYIIIQSYVKSKKGPILLRTFSSGFEKERIKIEKTITLKSIEEVEFKNPDEQKLDSGNEMNILKEMREDILGIKSQISTFFDDKKKEKNISKIRDLGKELQKSLSALNEEAKSQK